MLNQTGFRRHNPMRDKSRLYGLWLFPLIIFLLFPGYVAAQGWIIVNETSDLQQNVPLVLVAQNIQAEFVEQVASYAIKQTFQNQSQQAIEGIFYFPLPRGSQVTDFNYTVNGKKLAGELLEKDKAREIYNQIVRKLRDPALLEYLSQDLFRANIFPVPAGQNCVIDIKFNQILPRQDHFYVVDYPLFQKQLGRQIRPYSADAALTFHFKMASQRGIQHIYSPTHQVDIVRQDQNHAEISFEGLIKDVANNRIQLYYQLGSDAVGLSLLSYRESDQSGYFLLIASPQFSPDSEDEQPKDVLFVLDVSGSMAGEKLEQAKQALLYCLHRLNPTDRFNLITFSTEPHLFREALQPVSAMKAAEEYVQKITAQGGTNIQEALASALHQNLNSARLFTIIFLTDGLPTVGVTNANEILQQVKTSNRNNLRIFTFGLGFDVNTFLIDKIAEQTNGVADYISPQENIEVVVSAFYEKISSPILTQVALAWHDVTTEEVYPRNLPDLFKGGELIVLGRYSAVATGEVVLTGKRHAESFQYSSKVEFGRSGTEYNFIPQLWATRKIGYLLDEIRLHGENQELVDEVVRLSKKYGILTPYTSYLAQEDESTFATQPLPAGRAGGQLITPSASQFKAVINYDKGGQNTGETAVAVSQHIKKMESSRSMDIPTRTQVQFIAGRTMILKDGIWREENLDPALRVVKIEYGSDTYFNLLDLYPELQNILSLGDNLEFSWYYCLIKIGATGEAKLTPKELVKIFNP